MNWNHFLLLLTSLYLTYYSINFLVDLYLAQKRATRPEDEDILSFSEEIQPRLITCDDPRAEQSYLDSPLESEVEAGGNEDGSSVLPEATGAVSLKELFLLAQGELIEYTKTMPYSP